MKYKIFRSSSRFRYFTIWIVMLTISVFMVESAIASENENRSWFTIGAGIGMNKISGIRAFDEKQQSGTGLLTGAEQDITISGHVFGRIDIFSRFGLEVMSSTESGPTVDITTTGAFLVWYPISRKKGFHPVVKIGSLQGNAVWDGLPGEFESSTGTYVSISGEVSNIFVELFYRKLTNSYTRAFPTEVAPSEIDLSGIGVKVGFGFRI